MFRGKSARFARAACGLVLLLTLGACRQKMANQARYDPYEASDFFADGMAARPRIQETVARGELSTDPFFDTGKINGQVADGFPASVKIDREFLDHGQERFNIYCSPCHGQVGDGNGMIPSRGYRRPPSFHTATLRSRPTGHFFDVMTNGFGSMPPYRTMIPAKDRWAIAAYIRALQISQNGTVADVPPANLATLNGAAQPASAAPHGGAH
jgi:mono/diheme cytochrome c family protein